MTQYLKKIISGAQSGADIAALDACLALSFPCGGTVPIGRKNEDGIIPEHYPVTVHSPIYEIDFITSLKRRTEINIEDSDATLLIHGSKMTPGSILTEDLCRLCVRPILKIHVDSDLAISAKDVCDFIQSKKVEILNVAGSRESKVSGIYEFTKDLITCVVKHAMSGELPEISPKAKRKVVKYEYPEPETIEKVIFD